MAGSGGGGLVTIGCDRVTKHAVTALLAGQADRSYLADTVRLGYVENTGGFLSLGADLPERVRTAVYTVATVFVLLALVITAVRVRFAGLSRMVVEIVTALSSFRPCSSSPARRA